MNCLSFLRTSWICLFIFISGSLLGEETLFCPFDDRSWKVGYEDQNNDEKITELILSNDNIAQWKELFTVQIFDNLPISPSEFIEAIEKTSKKNMASSERLQFNVVKKDPLNIFESSFLFKASQNSSTIGNDEYNIGRILKGKSALYYIRYTTKDANVFKQNKESWINRFKGAYLAEAPRPNQEGNWISFTSSGVYEQGKKLEKQAEQQFIDNQKMGYSLTLPKDWNVKELEVDTQAAQPWAPADALQFSSPDKIIEGRVVFLNVKEDEPDAKISHRYFEAYQKKHPQAKLTSQGNVQNVIGQEGHYYMIEDEDKKIWITCFSISKRVYCVELWTAANQFENIKNALENVIVNFQAQPKIVQNESHNLHTDNF